MFDGACRLRTSSANRFKPCECTVYVNFEQLRWCIVYGESLVLVKCNVGCDCDCVKVVQHV